MLFRGFIKVASNYDVMMKGLVFLDGVDEVVHKRASRVQVCSVSLIECDALLMPGGVSDVVRGGLTYLINSVDGKWWLSFPS